MAIFATEQLEVRSEGKIVVLEVDRQVALVVGLDSPLARVQGDMTGQIRISLGRMLRQEKELFEPVSHTLALCCHMSLRLPVKSFGCRWGLSDYVHFVNSGGIFADSPHPCILLCLDVKYRSHTSRY